MRLKKRIFQRGQTVVESILVEGKERGIGSIEALSSGFNLVARQPWLILLPIALSLFLWLGPRLSPEPLARQVVDLMLVNPVSQASEYAESFRTAADSLIQSAHNANLFALLAFGVPTIAPIPKSQTVLELSTWPAALALTVLLLACGIYLMVAYLGLIARQVRADGMPLSHVLGRSARHLWRFAVVGVMVMGATIVLSIPGMAVAGFLALVSARSALAVMSLLTWGILLAGMWLFFYLFFVPDAIVLDNVNVRQAIGRSLAVVRRNPGASLALILLTVMLTIGLGIVWESISKTTLGSVAAIIGNAYVGSALAAASLIFYGSRWYALEKEFAATHVAAAAPGQNTSDPVDK